MWGKEQRCAGPTEFTNSLGNGGARLQTRPQSHLQLFVHYDFLKSSATSQVNRGKLKDIFFSNINQKRKSGIDK